MNHLAIYRKAVMVCFLVLAFFLAGCEMPIPTDQLPPTLTPAPTMSLPLVSPTPPPTVDPLAPTVDPLAPTADPLAPTPEPGGQSGTEATAVPPQPTASTGTGGQTIHVVAPGDTLFSISQRYGVSQEAIIAANGLSNPNALVVGQQLIIPAPGTTPATPVPPTGTEQVYTVRPGDNLFRIGLAYGCTVDQLSAYNNIPYPYTIFVGDQIRIPPDC